MSKNTKSLCFALILALVSCAKKDPVTGEVINIEPNADKRAREYADQGGGIFGDLNNRKSGTTY